MGWELLLTSLLSLYFVLHDAISLVLCPFSEDWKIWILLCVDFTLFSSLVIFCLTDWCVFIDLSDVPQNCY